MQLQPGAHVSSTPPPAPATQSAQRRLGAIILACALVACSTEPNVPVVGLEQFDRLWSILDTAYVHFQLKGIDWNEVRSRLRPRAEMASGNGLAPILHDLVGELRDPHASITANGQRAAPYSSPRTLRDAGAFTRDVVAQLTNLQSVSGGRIVYGVLPGNIGYVHLADFLDDRLAEWPTVFSALANTDGMIVDVRDNSGGSLDAILGIVGYFTDRSRGGIPVFVRGRQVPSPSIVPPASSAHYANPTVTLINGGTVSAGESFTVMMGEMPQVLIVGDTTAGGGGSFSDAEPGIIELADRWYAKVPTTDLRRYDGTPVEWLGMPPDMRVAQSPTDATAGLDRQLAAALNYLTSATIVAERASVVHRPIPIIKKENT